VPADRLAVHLNGERLHAVEAPESFEATGSFDVELVNHGESVHTHLNLDGDLSEVATLGDGESNQFVDGESRQYLRVSVAEGVRPVSGRLKVASGYGSEERYVDVDIVKPEEPDRSVEVGESLTQPSEESTAGSGSGSLSALVATPELLVLALGIAAVGVAATAALVLDNLVVLVGSLVVLVGVLVAMYVLVGSS